MEQEPVIVDRPRSLWIVFGQSGRNADDFFFQVAIMKKMDHPNLIHLYEVIDVPLTDGLFMVRSSPALPNERQADEVMVE